MSGAVDARVLVAAISYLVAATLFLLGLQRMASPVTARSGIRWAGAGMLIATAATFLLPGLHNLPLIVLALVVGTLAAWVSGKRVAITDMPQMVALYNGMGGGSAAAIGAVELLRLNGGEAATSMTSVVLAVIGALIGAISLSGSVIAWAKLDGRMDKRYTFPGQQALNALVFLAALGLGVFLAWFLPVQDLFAGGQDARVFVIAFAIRRVSSMPAAPTMVPAMIRAWLPST
jgi:NAD(P) transhydrogenase subunit beta